MTEPVTDIKFPGGFVEFYYKIRMHAGQIVLGTVVAIDPASGGSSLPGYAVFRAGELQKSGTLPIPKKLPIERRLASLYDHVQRLTDAPPAIFAVELIRGKFTHTFLHWAVGTSIAASRAPVTIEVPIKVWKAVADATPGYLKSDETDAVCMGRAIISLAQEAIRALKSFPASPDATPATGGDPKKD